MERIITPNSRMSLLIKSMQIDLKNNKELTSATKKEFMNYIKNKQIRSNKKPDVDKYTFTIDKVYENFLDGKIIKKCIEFAINYDYMQGIACIYSKEDSFNKQAKHWQELLDKEFTTLNGLVNIDIESSNIVNLKQNKKIDVIIDKQVKNYFDNKYKKKQKYVIEKILKLYISGISLLNENTIEIRGNVKQEIEILKFIDNQFGLLGLIYLYEDLDGLDYELNKLSEIEDAIFSYLYIKKINEQLLNLTIIQRGRTSHLKMLLKTLIKNIVYDENINGKLDTFSPTSQKILQNILNED